MRHTLVNVPQARTFRTAFYTVFAARLSILNVAIDYIAMRSFNWNLIGLTESIIIIGVAILHAKDRRGNRTIIVTSIVIPLLLLLYIVAISRLS